MTRRHKKTITGRILENILFLAEVFGDKADADIPDVPVLELQNALSYPIQEVCALIEHVTSLGGFGNRVSE